MIAIGQREASGHLAVIAAEAGERLNHLINTTMKKPAKRIGEVIRVLGRTEDALMKFVRIYDGHITEIRSELGGLDSFIADMHQGVQGILTASNEDEFQQIAEKLDAVGY